MTSDNRHLKDSSEFNRSKPPVISIIQATLFGILPGIAFALSVYVALALVTFLARAVRILG